MDPTNTTNCLHIDIFPYWNSSSNQLLCWTFFVLELGLKTTPIPRMESLAEVIELTDILQA